MAFALISKAIVQAGNNPTTSGIDTTGADLLIGCIGSYGGTAIGTFSDSKGNTWTPLTTYENVTTRTKIYWCVPTSVGSGHTATYAAGSFTFSTVDFSAWSGAHASPFDTATGNNGGTDTTALPGSVTPGQDNSLVVTCVALGSNATANPSINGGFTIDDTINYNGGTGSHGSSWSHLIQTSAAAANPTWTFSGATGYAAAIAVFKPGAGGGGGGSTYAVMPRWNSVRR